jgi:hypothetical protein
MKGATVRQGRRPFFLLINLRSPIPRADSTSTREMMWEAPSIHTLERKQAVMYGKVAGKLR